ncbi:ATP-dependent RNA helicase DBP3-like isoform X1 [Miscanthus floridulus]|uniref:ATP-dependent RNA helicase DBP3-like isoform X1 n=1 Tax=Miscanthus floridulus TaxID=154761 RepID=UPI00345A14A9
MAKGDDALARKRNRVRRKRLRSSENAVSARVAAIIASKRRRKSGKRRGCEGMCFSLPTPDDPFNERHGKKRKVDDESTDDTAAATATAKDGDDPKKKVGDTAAAGAKDGDNPKKKGANTKKQQPLAKAGAEAKAKSKAFREKATGAEEGRVDFDRPSKFLVVCLNAIRDAVAPEDGGGSIHGAGDWGVELWRCCSAHAPCDVLDASGASATVAQTAWLVSTACDIVARKERLGMVVSCPFLLYLVPSQEKAAQVRSICKPLKPLGIHSVSLHPGASIEHQISGLKTCEPEFLIATPERLLELVSLKAIDISSVSILVIDGLKCFVDHNVIDKIFSIREAISNNPQITIFTDPSDKKVATMAKSLLRGRITKLSINDSVSSRSAFIAQHVHFCPSEELKTSKVKEILEQILQNHPKKTSKVLLVVASDQKARHMSSSLKLKNCTVIDDSHVSSFTICSSVGLMNVIVKDRENMVATDIEEFETVLVVDLPPSVDEYVEILTGAALHVIGGEVHSIFCNTDASIAKPLAELLADCSQVVPEFLKNLESS